MSNSPNISVTTGAQEAWAPDYDEDVKKEIHETHEVVELDHGKGRCKLCSMMDYWPGIERKCRGRARKKSNYTKKYARRALKKEVDRFFDWWESREDGENHLPSMNEWAANFHEWRK